MKLLCNTIFFLFAIVAISNVTESNAQWTPGTINGSYGLLRVTSGENVHLCSGYSNKIFSSNDLGVSWDEIPIDIAGVLDTIFSAVKVDPNTIVCVSANIFDVREYILRSTDNGATWAIPHVGPPLSGLQDLEFVSATKGIAVGKLGRILRTLDGGAQWQLISSGTAAWLRDVHFVNDQLGFACGDGVILQTTNGGDTWSVILSSTSRYGRIASFDGQLLYVTTLDNAWLNTIGIQRSLDGGVNWSALSLPFTPRSGLTTTVDKLFAATDAGLAVSYDQGVSWFLNQGTATPLMNDINIGSDGSGVAVGQNSGTFYNTTGLSMDVPVAYFTPPSGTLCVNDPTTFTNLSPIGVTYEWYVDGVMVSSEYDPLIVLPTSMSTVLLIATNQHGSTQYQSVISATNVPIIEPFSLTTGGNVPVCHGGSRTVQIQGADQGHAYRLLANGQVIMDWTPYATGFIGVTIPSITTDLLIEATARKINVCDTAYQTLTGSILVVPLAQQIGFVTPTPSVCLGSAATVELSGLESDRTYTVTWGHNAPGYCYISPASSVYQDPTGPISDQRTLGTNARSNCLVTVTAAMSGCSTSVAAPLVIVSDSVNASFTMVPTYPFVGEEVQLTSNSWGTQLLWTSTGDVSTAPTDPVNTAVFPNASLDANVALIVTNNTGCTDTMTNVFNVLTPAPASTMNLCSVLDIQDVMHYTVTDDDDSNTFIPLDMVADAFGNTIICGTDRLNLGPLYMSDSFLRKYGQDGTLLWSKEIVLANAFQRSSACLSVDTDPQGNIFVIGRMIHDGANGIFFSGDVFTGSTDPLSFAAKYTPDGTLIWSIRLSGLEPSSLVYMMRYTGFTDILAMDDGGAIITLNLRDSNDRMLHFSDGSSLPLTTIAPPQDKRYMYLIHLNAAGELLKMVPGPQSVNSITGTGHLGVPIFSTSGGGLNDGMASHVPLAPVISSSCAGRIHVLGPHNDIHEIFGEQYGDTAESWWGITTYDLISREWIEHKLIARRTGNVISSFSSSIFSRPILRSIPNSDKNVICLTGSANGTGNLTFVLPTDDDITGPAGTSIIGRIDPLTGIFDWIRQLRGIEVSDVLCLNDGRIAIYGQAKQHASIAVDDNVFGINDLVDQDLVWILLDADGEVLGIHRLDGPRSGLASRAAADECDRITFLGCLPNAQLNGVQFTGATAFMAKASFDVPCPVSTCIAGQFNTCSDNIPNCEGEEILLSWTGYNVPGQVSITIEADDWNGPEIIGQGLSPINDSLMWSPPDSMYTGASYHLTLLDGSGTSIDEIVVQLYPAPTVSIEASDSVVCAGEEIILSATPGFTSYSWQNGSVTDEIIVENTDLYQVTVFDAMGCSAMDSINVTILSDELFIANDTVLCEPGVQLAAIEGYDTYNWSTGYSGPQYVQLIDSTGWVVVQAENSQGCSITDSIYVSVAIPLTAELIAYDTMCIASTIVADIPSLPGVSFAWGNGSTASTHPVLLGPNSYSLILTDQIGCVSIVTVDVVGVSCVGLPEHFLPYVLVSPNPSHGNFFLDHSEGISFIGIQDVLGRIVWSRIFDQGQGRTEVDISNEGAGTYYLQVLWNSGTTQTIRITILE